MLTVAMLGLAIVVPALSLGYAAHSWRTRRLPATRALSEAASCAGTAVFLGLLFPWQMVGDLVRWSSLVMLWGTAALYAWSGWDGLARRRAALRPSGRDARNLLVGIFIGIVVPLASVWVTVPDRVTVSSPFADGTWAVAQGGSTVLINAHRPSPTQRYALDLVRLDRHGRRAAGFAPGAELEAYHAWGAAVVAPADGVVLVAQDGLPDLPAGQRDRANPAGNHVVLAISGDVRLVLAHLRSGSVAVREGQRVSAGQHLGQVGNSGHTTEPHLHLHAEMRRGDEWVGVPLVLDGRVLHRGHRVRGLR